MHFRIFKRDTGLVRGKLSSGWGVIQSSPLSQAIGLQDILKKRFPHYEFNFWSISDLPLKKKDKDLLKSANGLIVELKSALADAVPLFDRIQRLQAQMTIIFIVTPQVYRSLMEKRRDRIDHTLIILSELVSLDYLLQLPRLMEEVVAKRDLKQQNEKLQRMIKARDDLIDSGSTDDSVELVEHLIEEKSHPHKGLRVTLSGWQKIKHHIGSKAAQNEVLSACGRAMSQIVRQSDRILHSQENEFIIFLSNATASTLHRCEDRITQALAQLKIEANNKCLSMPFRVASLD